MKNTMTHRLIAEFSGTMFFVLIGCGTAITATSLAGLGVALAFGLTLATAHYIAAPISGGHLNPALSFALWLSKKMEMKEFLYYVAAQLLGATVAIGILCIALMGKADFNHMFYTNGFEMASPNGSTMMGAGVIEIVLSMFFILTFLVMRDSKASCACTSTMLGFTFAAGYFLATPFTGGSLNPARSFGPALFEGGYALQQVWFFFVMPMIGSVLAMLAYKVRSGK
ncbi:aquaporin [Alphaproteobacteria bacterium]|jgi:aquaporin Z|nr:aquaporin [Alphaproteobacteria bacterium]